MKNFFKKKTGEIFNNRSNNNGHYKKEEKIMAKGEDEQNYG